jgi:hypothetical protein
LIATPWQDAARDTVGRWSARTIHDSVAAIARQPAYSTSVRQSLLGRFFRFLYDQYRALRDALGGSANVRFLIITAVALIVLVIVARIVVARRAEESRSRVRAKHGIGRARADYWQSARDLSAAGDHAAACHALYAAVLDALVRSGGVHFHPSKTSGDYARELVRRGSVAAPPFLAFARQFERTVFGLGDIGADDFERLSATAIKLIQPPMAA